MTDEKNKYNAKIGQYRQTLLNFLKNATDEAASLMSKIKEFMIPVLTVCFSFPHLFFIPGMSPFTFGKGMDGNSTAKPFTSAARVE